MNTVIITGRFAADPELRQTQSGKSVTSFTLAVDRRGKEKQTDWIDCVAWEKTAETVSRYFAKGKPATVEGALQTRQFEDKQGNKRKAIEIVVRNIEFVPKDSTASSAPYDVAAAPSDTNDFMPIEDEDLPF